MKIQPNVGIYVNNGKVLLVDGHHRLAAYKALGMEMIEAKMLSPYDFKIAAKQMQHFSSALSLELKTIGVARIPDVKPILPK